MVFWYLFFFRIPKKTTESHDVRPSRSFRLTAYALFIALCMLAVVLALPLLSPEGMTPAWERTVLGLVVICLGQALMLGARHALSFLSNHGLIFSIARVRVHSGVYRYMRHPLYVGLALALAGMTVAMDNAGAFGVVLFLVSPVLLWRGLAETWG